MILQCTSCFSLLFGILRVIPKQLLFLVSLTALLPSSMVQQFSVHCAEYTRDVHAIIKLTSSQIPLSHLRIDFQAGTQLLPDHAFSTNA